MSSVSKYVNKILCIDVVTVPVLVRELHAHIVVVVLGRVATSLLG